MGLFAGGNSTKNTTNNYSLDQSYTDFSRTDNSYNDESVQIDNSVTTITDGGAFDVASDALTANQQTTQAAIEGNQKVVDGAYDFGESALDVAAWSSDNARDISESSLDFGQSVVDRALDSSEATFTGAVNSVKDSNRLNHQLITGAMDRSLAIASERSATQSENVMTGVTKIGFALAAVVAVGFIANAVRKS